MFENYKVYETTLAGRPLKLETGMMAQLANLRRNKGALHRYGFRKAARGGRFLPAFG